MTSERKPSGGQYKQVLIPWIKRPERYTSCTIGEDDFLQTRVWEQLRTERLKIDNYQCAECKAATNLQVHHIRYPFVWGEEDVIKDLITWCDTCHAKKHNKN